jgi:hypothetical protein
VVLGERSKAEEFERMGKQLVDIAKRLEIPNAQYRNDPVSRAREAWKGLTALGLMRQAPAFEKKPPAVREGERATA